MASMNGHEVMFPYFDRPRHLRFGWDEFLELERMSGRAPLEFVKNILNLSPRDVQLAVWIGLKWEDKRVVTQEWVGKQLSAHLRKREGLVGIIKKLDEALTESGYFQPEATAEGEGEEGTNGTDPLAPSSVSQPTPLRAVE